MSQKVKLPVNITNEKPKRPLSKCLQTRKSRAILVKGKPVSLWWEVSGQRLYNHDCQSVLESQIATDHVIWQSHSQSIWAINQSWKTHNTPTSTNIPWSNSHNVQEMKGKRITGCKRKEKHMGHRNTINMIRILWKCKKKKKGICGDMQKSRANHSK